MIKNGLTPSTLLLVAALLIAGCNQATTSAVAPGPTGDEAPPEKTEQAAAKPAEGAKPQVAPLPAATAEPVQAGKGSRWKITPEQISQRLTFVGTLIETSSGAKQIESKGTPEAVALREKARQLHSHAAEASKKNDLAKADTLLSEATNTMFQGVRLSDSGTIKAEKGNADYDRRMESVKVLLQAHDRIAAEKNVGSAGQTADQINTLVKQAQDLRGKGDLPQARATLDKAYVIAKLAIEKMRRGDTLVRSLNFASKEEEYHYEIDRNDTHRMLVKMLVQNQGPDMEKMVQGFLDAAAKLRQEAEQQAAKGDHAGAVTTLENSTKELVKAIRGAGVFIPG